jgi:hypothetical protein
MDNQFLLNPFFLDSPAPLLNRLLKPTWIVTRPAIAGSSQSARIQAIHAPVVERARRGRGGRSTRVDRWRLPPHFAFHLNVAHRDPVPFAVNRNARGGNPGPDAWCWPSTPSAEVRPQHSGNRSHAPVE